MKLLYSPKKKNTNGLAEYSVKKPATNSLSASTKSNGGLFVSATVLIKNIINNGNNGITNHIIRCVSIYIVIFNVLTNIIHIIYIVVNTNS